MDLFLAVIVGVRSFDVPDALPTRGMPEADGILLLPLLASPTNAGTAAETASDGPADEEGRE